MINEILKKLAERKFLLILLVLGIVIMVIPDISEKGKSENVVETHSVNEIKIEKLERMLKKIKGVSSCEVFVTYENQGKNNFAYDISTNTGRDMEIKLSDDEPLIESVDTPEIRGIFVLVSGNGVERNEILHIIKGATGVPMHRIYVKISEG